MNGHKSCILWFTGLSGSGKTTIANALEKKLFSLGIRSYILDGDNVRHGLNQDLGHNPHDRSENIRRIAEVAKLFIDAGVVTLSAFISPYRLDRKKVRSLVDKEEFIEIYVKCPLELCEKRDPKGLYKQVREGKIVEFTGVSAPYEEPEKPELVIETNKLSIDESVSQILKYLKESSIIN